MIGATRLGFIDTHTHLHYAMQKMELKSFEDFDRVVYGHVEKESKDNVVYSLDAVINVWCEAEELVVGADHSLLDMKEHVYGSFGLHPHNARLWSDDLEKGLRSALSHPKTRALGECGLDFHYNLSPREDQLRVFRKQCEMAVELNLPLVVHSREAEDDTLDILKSCMPTSHLIHLHCFTSSLNMAQSLLHHFPNCYLGFTGVATFKSSNDVQTVIRNTPLNRLLLETDAPFMAPTPYRGKTCHSGMSLHTAKKICELKEVPLQEGFAALRENAIRMYRLKL